MVGAKGGAQPQGAPGWLPHDRYRRNIALAPPRQLCRERKCLRESAFHPNQVQTFANALGATQRAFAFRRLKVSRRKPLRGLTEQANRRPARGLSYRMRDVRVERWVRRQTFFHVAAPLQPETEQNQVFRRIVRRHLDLRAIPRSSVYFHPL